MDVDVTCLSLNNTIQSPYYSTKTAGYRAVQQNIMKAIFHGIIYYTNSAYLEQ